MIMKNIKIFYTIFLIVFAVTFVSAQDDPNEADTNLPRNNTLRIAKTLDLTPDQIQKVRELNQLRRPQRRAALQNLKQAKDELDAVIYSDIVDEANLQIKLKSVVEAQAELTKLNTRYELAVRNILTPEQLIKFRELRNRTKQQREDRIFQRQQRRKNRKLDKDKPKRNPQNAPLRRRNNQ